MEKLNPDINRENESPKKDLDYEKMEQEGLVAHSVDEINEKTKLYVGKLEENIFQKIPKNLLDSMYTSFPEGKIKVEIKKVGGNSPKETLEGLYRMGIDVTGGINNMIYENSNDDREKRQFSEIEKQDMTFVTLSVGDIIKDRKVDFFDLLTKAKELGLKEVPRIAGVEYAKHYNFDYSQLEQPKYIFGKDIFIASNPLSVNSYDHPTHHLSSMQPTIMTLTIAKPNPNHETRSWKSRKTGIDTIKYDYRLENGLEFSPNSEFLFCLDRADLKDVNERTLEERYKIFEQGATERKLLNTILDDKIDSESTRVDKESYEDFCKNITNKKVNKLIEDFFFQAPRALERVGRFARLAEVDAPSVTLKNEITMLKEVKDVKKEDQEFILDFLKSEYPKIFEKIEKSSI